MTTRVYLVEDHKVMREILGQYLESTDDIRICGASATAEEALDGQISAARPDVVVLDLALPGRSGLDLVADIRRQWDIPCLVLSGHRETRYVRRAIEVGAAGYVVKGHPAEVPNAIRNVLAGGTHVAPSLREDLNRWEPG